MAITQVSTSVLKDGAVTSAKLDTNIAIDGNLTVDTDTLYVDSANNRVGIGTTSPSERLEISSVMSTSPTSNIFLSAGGNNALGGGGSLIFGTSATAGTPELYNAKISGVRSSSGDGSSDLLFATTYVSTSTSPITRLTIKDTGNVGIGTDSPGSKLSIDSVLQDGLSINSSDGDGPYAVWKRQGASIGFVGNSNALSLSGNTNFGVRATNDLVFAAGGASEKMRITSAGNVGIGTTSPSTSLSVQGTTNNGINIIGVGTTAARCFVGLNSSNHGYLFATGSSGQSPSLINSAGGNSYISGGNVGIGTASPGAKLHVYNSSGGDATSKASMLSEAVLKLQPHATNSTNLLFAQVNGGNGIGLQVTNGSATANWDLALSPFGGNVGIGVSSPSATLDANVTGNNTVFRFTRDTGTNGRLDLDFQNADSNFNSLYDYAFQTNGTERMRITSTGNIQIGTASNFYLAKYSDSQLLVQGPYGNIRIGPANSSYAHFATDRSTFYFGNNIQIGGGIYDYQDTNYYLDPASLSRFNQVNMDGKSTMKYSVSDLNSVSGSVGVTGFKGTYQASNRPGSGNYATGIEFTYHDSNARTQLAAASSGSNDTGELWVRSEAWSTSSWSQWWKLWHQGNDGSGSGLDADLLDGIDSGSFVRSDANDTLSGQYTFTKTNDHAIRVGTIRGTAVGSQAGEFIQMYERVNIGGPSGWGASNTATPSKGLSTYGGTRLAVYTNYTESGGSMRAPVFYDSNNTGYYLNPAGSSNMSSIALKGSTYSSGIDSVTDAALIIDRGFRIYNDDGSYLRSILQFDTSAQINIGQGGTALISSVNLLPGNAGYVYAANSFRSPIFYDSNDTSYYLDPSGASSLLNYLYIGEAAYSTSTGYVGLKTEHMSGANDYMMISGKTDGNTYISGKDGSGVYIRGGGNLASNQIYIPDGSTITATTSSFQVTGDVVAYSSSDERLKDNKKNINNALEKVESLNGVEFDWNDKQDVYEGHDIGVIAQEVEKIAPELVSTRDNGYKAVKYEKLVPLLIEAIKELSDKVKALENK